MLQFYERLIKTHEHSLLKRILTLGGFLEARFIPFSEQTNSVKKTAFRTSHQISKLLKILKVGTTEAFKWYSTKSDRGTSSLPMTFPGRMIMHFLRQLTKSLPQKVPIDHHALPAFLFIKAPLQIHQWEICRELRNLKANKSASPDGLPVKLATEFPCEWVSLLLTFSLHLYARVMHMFYLERCQLKLLLPAAITKPRPISLTALLAKVSVFRWVPYYITCSIERNQNRRINNSSTGPFHRKWNFLLKTELRSGYIQCIFLSYAIIKLSITVKILVWYHWFSYVCIN